jgi:thiamine transport system substrate-binding protein
MPAEEDIRMKRQANCLMPLLLGTLILGLATTSNGGAGTEPPTLVVATYDSFVAKNGLGPAIFPLFEKKCGCKLKALASGDGAQMLSKLQLEAERGKPQAHVVLGLDQATWERARPYLEAWGEWVPRGYGRVPSDLRVAPGFLPFDYGVLAFMADTEQLKALKLEAPRKLADLLGPRWRRQVILQDPRTSTPGLGFLLYAAVAGGEGFWPKFKSQWLTLAPGWDAAYGLFLKKEAPLVWSYTTSQAYHEAHGDVARRYRALVFEEGNPTQIEGAALIQGAFEGEAGAERRRLAREFLEFLLSDDVQRLVPSRNWMLPVMPGTALPDSFKNVPVPKKRVNPPSDAATVERLLVEWKRAIGSAQ